MSDDKIGLANQVGALLTECQPLRGEIQRLRELLESNDIDPEPPKPVALDGAPSPVPRSALTTEQKITLFRSLFRGREDVFALRWEAPDGRHGYSPSAQRDWNAYYASRPENRKRVDKETRKYIPLSDQAIHAHLAGKQTVGVYPLLRDETCWFLAVDFDKKSWQQDAGAFRSTCLSFGVPAVLERSRFRCHTTTARFG